MKTLIATLAAAAALVQAAPALAYTLLPELQREWERTRNLVTAPAASAEAAPKTDDRAQEATRQYHTGAYRGDFEKLPAPESSKGQAE
jgi:hypothetical protein